jgi:hypothetical protein
LTPEEILAEIEWAAGLIPMPDHLVKAGTKVTNVRQMIVINSMPVAGVDPEIVMLDCRIIPHPRPYKETRGWGELISREAL